MSTTPQNLLQLARQGNPDAIAALMNQHLQARGITAQVTQQGNALNVLLESTQTLSQQDLVAYVEKGIKGLSLPEIHHLSVSGKQAGHEVSDWVETIALNSGAGAPPPLPPNRAVSEPTMAVDQTLDFDAILMNGQDPASPDLDLDLQDFDSSAVDELDLGLDSSFGEAAADDLLDLGLDASDLDPSDMSLDLDLELGLTDAASSAQGFDLNDDDLQQAGDALNAALADLDMPSDGATGDSWADTSLDYNGLDLGFDESLATDDLDFDLGDDLGLTDGVPGATGLEDLDLDLGLADAEPAVGLEELDLGLDVETTAAPSTFELDSSDLDFDFDDTHPPLEPTDLDLALDRSLDPSDAADLDFNLNDSVADLGVAETADSLDMADLDLDFDPGTSFPADSDLDLDLGDVLGLEDSGVPQGDVDVDLGTSLDLDTSVTSPPDEGFDLGAALDLDDTSFSAEEGELSVVSGSTAPDSEALSLGSGLEGDLWDSQASAFPGVPVSSLAADDGNDIEWDLEEPVETPMAEGQTTDLSSDNAPDIEWDGTALNDEALDLNAMADDSPLAADDADFELADVDLAAPAFPRDSEPVDLMLSETLDLSGEEDTDLADLSLVIEDEDVDDGTFLQTGPEFPAGQEIAAADSGFSAEATDPAPDFDAAAPLPSPIDKLLKEDDFIRRAAYPEKLSDSPDAENLDFDPNAAGEKLAEADIGDADPYGETAPGFDPALSFEAPATLDPAQFMGADDVFEDADMTVEAPIDLEDEDLVEDTPADLVADSLDPMDTVVLLDEEGWPETQLAVPEPGLTPEDFPMFDPTQTDSMAQDDLQVDIDQAELGQWSTEAGDVDFDASDFGPVDGEGYDIDTLELDTGSEGSASRLQRFSPAVDAEDEFPLAPVEDFDDGDPLDSLSQESAPTGIDRSREEFDFSDDVVGPNLANGSFVANLQTDWDDSDEPDDTDKFLHEGAEPGEGPISTSVSLTEEDLDSLDNASNDSSSNWLVGLGLGVVGLGLAAVLLNALWGNIRQQPTEPVAEPPVELPVTPEVEPETPVAEAPPQAEPEAPAPAPEPPAATPPAAVDYFREAVNAAQNAANLAQTASTKAEWQAVADSWSRAIELMKQVPEADPNYAVAQQKAVEYQPNLNYAQQNADRL